LKKKTKRRKNSRPEKEKKKKIISHLRPKRRQERAANLRLDFLREVHPLRGEDGLMVVRGGDRGKRRR
jgi:hypothetical protein